MLLRSAMSAAAGHTISTLMPSAVVRDIPATANVYVSAPVVDGCRRLFPARSLPVSHAPDGLPVAVSSSLTECAAGRAGHPQSTAFSCGQVHRCPSAATVSPGVAWLPAQDHDVARPAGAQHPLGHVHGKVAHGLDLGVGFDAVEYEPEVGSPAAEPDRLVLPCNPALVEVCRPPGLQLAAECSTGVLGDGWGVIGAQSVGRDAGGPPVQRCCGILPEQPFLLRTLARLPGDLQQRLSVAS